MKKKKILAIIPCRSGSKSLKNKNILKIFNKPLVYYSIFFAKSCKFIDKVIVSTDSKKYKKICEKHGADVPFLRPKKISRDNSLDLDFFKHAISWLRVNYNYKPDIIVHLRPTSPLRKIKILKKMISKINEKKIDSIKSISPLHKSIYKTWFLKKNNTISPVVRNDTKFIEPYNAPRQKLKKSYFENGVYNVFKSDLLKKNQISGKKIYGYVTNDNHDIDNINDLIEIKKKEKSFKNFKKYIES